MNPIPPMQAERLFPHFIDPVDGVLCLPASATAADIVSRVKQAASLSSQLPPSLRFPLILDARATLCEQVNASTFAPASCRFGPYCDNILGINWQLPDGRIARIGERVVKTTTGYDWLRFLLHSGTRFGQPLDYVLRLRPDCGCTLIARFEGEPKALRGSIAKLLHSGWMHWWDAVDFICEGSASQVRITVHCPPSEAHLFEAQLSAIAATSGLQLTLASHAASPADGLPDLVIKTTPDRAPALASELASHAVRCIALCYNGVVHVYANAATDFASLIQPHLAELHAIGGDWHSRHLPPAPPSLIEAEWIKTLMMHSS